MITEYHPTFAARAHDLCIAGLTEAEIATVLGLSVGMLRAWRGKYADFDYAWTAGSLIANSKVVGALFKRACGYDVLVWKETQHGMMLEKRHIEPSVVACMAWLTNKDPARWTNSKNEPNLPGTGNITIDNMSDIEAARRVAFALSKALYEQSRSIENGDPTDPPETE